MGRIYDVLNSLESDDLVRSQAASRPKKYVAVDPDTALDRLLADRKRELEAKAEQYEEIAADLVDGLEAPEPADEPFWTAAVGPEDTVDLLVDRLSAADERIVVAAAAPSGEVDLTAAADRIVDQLERAIERGVEVSMLLPPSLFDHLPEPVGREYERRLRPHEDFHYRVSEEVTGTFELIDDAEVCIEVPHPMGGETFAVIDVTDPEFAAEIDADFESLWERAREV